MKLLRSSRVVVIDEAAEDAIPLLSALGANGVSATYVKGDAPDTIPDEPLNGVRWVFLDLNLNGALEAHQYIPHAVAVLKASVNFKESSGVSIIVWSRHDDEKEALRAALSKAGILYTQLTWVSQKAKVIESGKTLVEIVSVVQNLLASKPGETLLLAWENDIREAVPGVTQRLAQWATVHHAGDRLPGIVALAKSHAGEPVADEARARDCLRQGLNACLLDEVSRDGYGVLSSVGPSDVLIKQLTGPTPPALAELAKAELNSILLTGATSGAIGPGNLYVLDDYDGKVPNLPSAADLRKRIVKQLFGDVLNKDTGKAVVADNRGLESAEVVLADVSPACDHQRATAEQHRLIAGLVLRQGAVSNNKMKAIRGEQLAIKVLELCRLPLGGRGNVVAEQAFCAKLLFTLDRSALGAMAPQYRLRSGVVTDFQAWLATHVARPGYVSVR